ncbi:MAG: ATP-grasp domain-containing protein [Deltaproteobacteria bacterium]
MRIGLAYNVKPAEVEAGLPEDAFEEYDSEETVGHIRNGLASLGHEVVLLPAGPGIIDRLREERPELVFNIAEGEGGRCREAHLPALLEMLGIPYVGSDPLTLCVTLDKPVAKRLVGSEGFPTPRFRVCRDPEDLREGDLPFPVIVKPAFEGSSKGVRLASRATALAQARQRIAFIRDTYGQEALVEEFVSGPEVTVGLVGNGTPRVIGQMEIRPRTLPPGEFVYSLEVKRDYLAQVEYLCPPSLPADAVSRIEHHAKGIHRALGCRDVSRIDFRIDANGVPQFLECNPLPGLSPGYGDLPILAEKMGIAYRALLSMILESALARLGMTPT